MKRFTTASATALLVALSQPALAQTTDLGDDVVVATGQYLYTDQVNALKSPTPIIDVPQSLSIITADEIAVRGFNTIGQIINYTPGVNTSQGEGHRDAIVFRGVRSTADFFIDGVRDDVQYYRPLYNLEQVEVLRGPNALLFGRGGTGGVLNRVTKKGVIGESFTGYQASIDTFGAFSGQLDTNFDVSDTAAIRVNALYENLSNHRDFYDGDRYGFNPTARIEVTPATTLDLSYEYADHARFIDRGIPTANGSLNNTLENPGRPVEAFEDITFGDDQENFLDLQAHLLRATVQHSFRDNLKGNFSAFYGDYDKVYSNFYASGYSPETDPNVVTLDGYIDTTERQNFVLSGNLIGDFDTGRFHHTIVTGAEYIDTSSDQNRFNSFWNTTEDDNEVFNIARPLNLRNGVGVNASGATTTNDFTVDLNDDTRVGVDVFSAYIQDEIAISDMLDIIVGVRFDSFDIEVFNVVENEIRTRKDEEFSPRLGLVFKPQENISLYGSYSESFQPRSGEQFANINGDNNQLDPNIFTNLEAGLKWDFIRGLSFTAALFEIEQESPSLAEDGESFDIIETTVNGFEIQLQGQLSDDWFVTAGYSYLDGEQAGGDLRPRELPENTFSLWSNYQVTEQFGVGAGLTYQDETFINNSNTAILPSYTRIDAAAYYDVSDALRLQVNIENLTDELYFPNAHATHQATVGAPLNAKFTVSGRF